MKYLKSYRIFERQADDNIRLFTGKCWKHHISEHFENGMPTEGGVGKGETVFIDYSKMIDYLKEDGRKWHICELELKNEPLIFEFGNDYMATIASNKKSISGFYPIDLLNPSNHIYHQ